MWYKVTLLDYFGLLFNFPYMLYLLSMFSPIMYQALPVIILTGGDTKYDIWNSSVLHMTLFAAPFVNFLGRFLAPRLAAIIVFATLQNYVLIVWLF